MLRVQDKFTHVSPRMLPFMNQEAAGIPIDFGGVLAVGCQP
jgi:hypothetical protein